jgi:hypothetical protein
MRQMPAKDPTDVRSYTRDASGFLATGETISTSTWAITGPDTALTLGTDSRAPTNDTTTATCWLLGGTENAEYVVSNTIVTSASPSQTKKLSFSVKVLKR